MVYVLVERNGGGVYKAESSQTKVLIVGTQTKVVIVGTQLSVLCISPSLSPLTLPVKLCETIECINVKPRMIGFLKRPQFKGPVCHKPPSTCQ